MSEEDAPDCWRAVRAPDLVPQVVEASMLADLIRDMTHEGVPLSYHEAASGVLIDVPRRRYLKDRTRATLGLGSLVVVVPCQDLEQIEIDLRMAPARRFVTGKPYRRVQGANAALLVTEEQRVALLAQIGEVRSGAAELAEKDARRMQEAIEDHNRRFPDAPFADEAAEAEKAAEAKREGRLTN